MAAKTGKMNSLFIEKEKDFYNRDFKKIFKGRITNATDKKFALEEYEKRFRFETEFPVEVNEYYKEFIIFFERHEKLGHPMDSVLRLAPKEHCEVSFSQIRSDDNDTEKFYEVGASFKKKVKKEKEIISDKDEDLNTVKTVYNQHFSRRKPEELITDYAVWKAKKRFLIFLQTELLQLHTSENLSSETGIVETTVLKNKDHTTRRQTLAIYYLDLHFKINKSGKEAAPLVRFIEFLTDKSVDNIKKALRNPLKNSEKKNNRADAELLKDLKYIRIHFDDLKLAAIVQLIDKEIAGVSEDMQ